ncbi:MAG: 30S ribosomal protein S9 [Bacteroidetes bacterium]|nr:30S ribosomal protein S9 [Bacteroidota bacterium]
MEVINTVGRRKTSVARVYLQKGEGKITVNDKSYKEYFKTFVLQRSVALPLTLTKNETNFDVIANVYGGGITGQAEAIRLAISRALVENDPETKATLNVESLLTRDPRMVERKKPGQKKARKKFQFSKR